MQKILKIALCVLLAGQPALAKPVAESDGATTRSPGKPSHPLQVEMVVDKTRLVAGVETDGKLVVSSSMPVEDMRVVLRPSPGVNVLSDGALERYVGRMRPGEPVELPLHIVPASDDARQVGVVLRAVKADGRVITRSLQLQLGEEPKRRNKAHGGQPQEAGQAGEATVEAEQEIIRRAR